LTEECELEIWGRAIRLCEKVTETPTKRRFPQKQLKKKEMGGKKERV